MRIGICLFLLQTIVGSVFGQSFHSWGLEELDRVGGSHSGPLLDGDEAYVTVGTELRVYDISDPMSLTQISSLHLGVFVGPEFILGETLVMNGGHLLIDIGDPAHPSVIHRRERDFLSGWLSPPLFLDERTGVEAGFGRVIIWDVSSMFAPVARWSLSDGDVFGAASVIAPEVFAVAWSAPVDDAVFPAVQQIGISTHTVEHGVEDWPTITLGEVAVQMNQICPQAGPEALIDLHRPSGSFTWLDPLAIVWADISFLGVNGESVSCEDGLHLLVFDVADPASPEFVSAHRVTPHGEAVLNQGHRFHIRGGFLGEEEHLVYDLSPDGMTLMQVLGEPWPPERIEFAMEDPGRSILTTGSHHPLSAYTLTPDGGFALLDSTPREMGQRHFLFFNGDHLVAVDRYATIDLLDISESGQLSSLGSLRLEERVEAAAQEAGLLFLLEPAGTGPSGPIPTALRLIDVSNSPSLLDTELVPGTWHDVLVDQDLVYLTQGFAESGEATGYLLRVTGEQQLEPLGGIDLPETGFGPGAAAGDLLALTRATVDSDVVEIHSVANPLSPELLTQITSAERVVDLWLGATELLVLVDDTDGTPDAVRVEIHGLDDPANPEPRGDVEISVEGSSDYQRLLRSGDHVAVVGDLAAVISLTPMPTLLFEGQPLHQDRLAVFAPADFAADQLAVSARNTGTSLHALVSGEVTADTLLNALLGHASPEAWMDLTHDGRLDAADQVHLIEGMP